MLCVMSFKLAARSKYAQWMRIVKMQLGMYALCSLIMGPALWSVGCGSSPPAILQPGNDASDRDGASNRDLEADRAAVEAPPGVVFDTPYVCAADVDAAVSATLMCAVGTSYCHVDFQNNGAWTIPPVPSCVIYAQSAASACAQTPTCACFATTLVVEMCTCTEPTPGFVHIFCEHG